MKIIVITGLFVLLLIIDFSFIVGRETSGNTVAYVTINNCYACKWNCLPWVSRSNYRTKKSKIRDLRAQVTELERNLTARLAEDLREHGAERNVYRDRLAESQRWLDRPIAVHQERDARLLNGNNDYFSFTSPLGNKEFRPSGSQFKPVTPAKVTHGMITSFSVGAMDEQLAPTVPDNYYYKNATSYKSVSFVKPAGSDGYDIPWDSPYWQDVKRSGLSASMGISYVERAQVKAMSNAARTADLAGDELALGGARSRRPYAPAVVSSCGSLFKPVVPAKEVSCLHRSVSADAMEERAYAPAIRTMSSKDVVSAVSSNKKYSLPLELTNTAYDLFKKRAVSKSSRDIIQGWDCYFDYKGSVRVSSMQLFR